MTLLSVVPLILSNEAFCQSGARKLCELAAEQVLVDQVVKKTIRKVVFLKT
jgi:hypothetical protein